MLHGGGRRGGGSREVHAGDSVRSIFGVRSGE